jgi:hypothetical protein
MGLKAKQIKDLLAIFEISYLGWTIEIQHFPVNNDRHQMEMINQ